MRDGRIKARPVFVFLLSQGLYADAVRVRYEIGGSRLKPSRCSRNKAEIRL